MNRTANVYIPPWLLISGLMVAGAALRWWNLGKSSIWNDEGFSIMLAKLPPTEILERTALDVHPPLYYLLLHYWMILFGSSEAAVRSLSLLSTIVIIPITYLLVRRLWNERGAQLAAVFVTVGPMLVRYGQEARMYGLAALLVVLAVYCLVRAAEHNRPLWWIAYAASLAGAMYTHYYSVFILPALLAFITFNTSRKQKRGWWNPAWWLSSLGALLLFAPWLPSAYAQFRRVKYFDWIPLADASTLPNNLLHLLAFGYPEGMTTSVKVVIGLLFIGLAAAAWFKGGRGRPTLLLFGLYAFAGPLLVYFASFSGSPFLERYFVFAAVGFYCLLALMAAMLPRLLQLGTLTAALVLFGLGSYNINADYTHDMKSAGNYVNKHYRPGDYLLSDVLLSYFDFSYYNRTGAPVHVWLPEGIDGYGESSLLAIKKDELVVRDLTAIKPANGRLWLVRKLDKPGTRGRLPDSWLAIGPERAFGDNSVQPYLVVPRSQK